MQGKVVVITGATSGIGEAAALRLAAMGARIVVVGRAIERTEATLAKLRIANPAMSHSAHMADLSSISETKRVASAIAGLEPHIDVLINNAGTAFPKHCITPDGLEITFATNHMSYFIMTTGLISSLKGASSRIISTASAAHRGARLDFDELVRTRWAGERYRAFEAYGRSKLANILFTRTLARRLEGEGIVANCLHPGVVASRFFSRLGRLGPAISAAMRPFSISAQKGADTIVWLASDPEAAGVTGGYFIKRRLVSPAAVAQDDVAAARLWAESERIAAAAA